MPQHNCCCRFAFAQINNASGIGFVLRSASVMPQDVAFLPMQVS